MNNQNSRMVLKLLPKASPEKFMQFITSDAVISALAAVIVAPTVIAMTGGIVGNIPFLKDHFTIAMLLVGFVVFVLSSMIPTGKLRVIVIGAAAGVAVAGIISHPTVADLASKFRR